MLKPAIRVQIIIIRVLTLSSVKWHIKLSISVSITHASGRCVSMHFDNINKNLKIKNKEKKRGGLRVGVSKGHDSWLPGASLATLASEPCWLTVALVTQHAFALHPDLWRRLQTPALKIASIKSIYIAEYALPCKKEKKCQSSRIIRRGALYFTWLYAFTAAQFTCLPSFLRWLGVTTCSGVFPIGSVLFPASTTFPLLFGGGLHAFWRLAMFFTPISQFE